MTSKRDEPSAQTVTQKVEGFGGRQGVPLEEGPTEKAGEAAAEAEPSAQIDKFENMRPHLEDVVQTFIDQFRFLFCGLEEVMMV